MRLVAIHKLIENGATGSSNDIALRLDISRRQVWVYLDALKELGKPTVYNRKTGHYEYEAGSRWKVDWPKSDRD